MIRNHKRVGLIGVGTISEWHARALRAAGLEITAVSTRSSSQRLHDFATRHGIAHVFDDWRAMLEKRNHWNALLIATHPDGTPDILSAALDLNVPILVEKPVAWTSARLAKLCATAHDRVIVGYNRRFYRPVREARREARQGPPLIAHLSLPEAVIPAGESVPAGRYLEPFFENSCHGLDLARFILGNLHVKAVQRLMTGTGHLSGLVALLSTDRGDLVQLTGNWGAPANFAFSLNRAGRRFELSPFELATVYEGMDVLEPSDGCPVRRYMPREIRKIILDDADLREKPGFVGQSVALGTMIEGNSRPVLAASLRDALAVVELCENLAGMSYPAVQATD